MGWQSSDSERLSGPAAAVAVAETQRGLITARQLGDLGFTKSRRESWLRSGRLHRVFHGVYAVGRPVRDREALWLAAVLTCGAGAVLSHLSAALLWEIVPAEGAEIEVSAPRSRTSRPGIVVHRPLNPPPAMFRRGIPVTTLERTLEDLARTFGRRELRRAVGEAELRPDFNPRLLSPRVWALVDPDAAGAGTPPNLLERRFMRICREAELPRPVRNREWGRWEIDFLWPSERVAVETDGRAVHARRTQFARDREKDRDLQLAGYTALRFTYAEVMRQPQMVADTCARALGLAKQSL